MAVIFAVMLSACSVQEQTGNSGADDEETGTDDSSMEEDEGNTIIVVDDSGTEVECNSDADCGQEVIGEPYCFQGNILTPRNIPKCVYPGTINSYCRMESKDRTTLCGSGEFCRDGECLVTAQQPCNDTDGGKDYDTQGKVTDGLLEVFNDQCKDEDVLLERYCSNGEFGRGLTEEHECRYRCSGGRCADRDED
ncbi:hypothetical protein GF345_05065 [Candidatus Woesearchaeota archaeon]|nr:hypothetical protein [Candidatus Woesearchaeota archaeon]